MKGEVIGITTAGMGVTNMNLAVSIVGFGLGKYLIPKEVRPHLDLTSKQLGFTLQTT